MDLQKLVSSLVSQHMEFWLSMSAMLAFVGQATGLTLQLLEAKVRSPPYSAYTSRKPSRTQFEKPGTPQPKPALSLGASICSPSYILPVRLRDQFPSTQIEDMAFICLKLGLPNFRS